jgi:hypothetical protein
VTCESLALTWKTNHAILLRNGADEVLRRCLSIVPRILISLSNFGEITVQFRGLGVVILYRLTSMGSEPILKERIDVNWRPNVMDGTKICRPR